MGNKSKVFLVPSEGCWYVGKTPNKLQKVTSVRHSKPHKWECMDLEGRAVPEDPKSVKYAFYTDATFSIDEGESIATIN